MDYQSLYLKTVVDLRKLAKDMNVRIPSGANKAVIINLLLEAVRAGSQQEQTKTSEKDTTDEKKGQNVKASPDVNEDTPKIDADKPEMVSAGHVSIPAGGNTEPDGQRANIQAEPDQDVNPRMRMAANPQVLDRRMPGRDHHEKGGSADERIRDGIRTQNGYIPRQNTVSNRGGENQNAAGQTAARAERQAFSTSRYEKRNDNPPSRYTVRQEGFQSRGNPRYEGQRQTLRSSVRQDADESRGRVDQESQNRFEGRSESNAEMRGRSCRQDNVDLRMPAGQDARDRLAFRKDSFFEDGTSAGLNRSSVYRNAETSGRDFGYTPADDRDRGVRCAQAGAEYPMNCRQDSFRGRREGYYNEEYRTSNPAVPEMLEAGECTEGSGILEIQSDGYGFLRAENYQQGSNDVYISIAQIRRFNLRMGDHVVGQTRPQREGDRYTAMMYITEVNGQQPEKMIGRKRFEELIPVYPNERLRLEQPGENDLSLRIIDLLAPIGKGQRGLIVSQPKAGKTTLLKKLANAITAAHPEIHLIVLLIDERPEEVTDMKRSIRGEVVYSTFDEPPESHTRVAEMVLERAQRLVEQDKDVVILMDSITRLARAYNLVIPPTGRSLSGGLDPGALHKPKRFFGAARNIENGGSLTIIATALIDTGSRMDDIIYEEFKGTGNMELHLDRKLSDRRIFPAVDMVRSGTRREELLLTEAELEGAYKVRRMLPNGNEQGDTEKIIGLMEKTDTNAEFFQRLSAYKSVYERSGFSMSKDKN